MHLTERMLEWNSMTRLDQLTHWVLPIHLFDCGTVSHLVVSHDRSCLGCPSKEENLHMLLVWCRQTVFVVLDVHHSCHVSGIDRPLIDCLRRLPRTESWNEVDLARRTVDLYPHEDVLVVESLFARTFGRLSAPVGTR